MMCLYVGFQVTSPLAYMFIAVHHNVSSEQPVPGVSEAPRYTYGYKDLCAVFFYFLICIVMHAIIQEYVLDVSIYSTQQILIKQTHVSLIITGI